MKEKIDHFSKGIFVYDNPQLVLSLSNIDILVEAGKVYHGSFVVTNDALTSIKGIVYSMHPALMIENAGFEGIENQVDICFDATYMEVNSVVKGTISIVTDCGEGEIPFSIKIKMPSCDTTIGPISDLFHFTNLAMSNWSEAKQLFKSEEFHRLICYYNSQYETLYKHLLLSGNASQALEEFLVYVHKKKNIRFTVDKTSVQYEVQQYSFTDKIVIHKDTWGYAQLKVLSDCEFIKPDRTVIWSEDFVANNFSLEYLVKPENMRYGKNYGRISIITPYQEILINIKCIKKKEGNAPGISLHKERQYRLSLYRGYLNMRMGRLSMGRYYTEADNTMSILRSLPADGVYIDLYKAYLLVISGKTGMAQTVLNLVKEDRDRCDRDDGVYAAILFLEALLDKGNTVSYDNTDRLKTLYGKENNFVYVWYILQINLKHNFSRQSAYDDLKLQYMENGVRSPLLYLEALLLINSDPLLMKEMDEFEQQVIRFGMKNGAVVRNTVIQMAYLIIKGKYKPFLLRRILGMAFDTYKINEVLEALCIYAVDNDCRDSEAYMWLSAGIDEQLRVNGMYEQCIAASAGVRDSVLPRHVFSYFDSAMGMSIENRTLFYSNIVRCRDRYDTAYQHFYLEIKQFTAERLLEGVLSDAMAVLYNNIITPDEVSSEMAQKLPDILFKHKLVSPSPAITSVCVANSRLEEEQTVSFINGEAYIDIFTENYEIYLCDEKGNRYCSGFEINTGRMISRVDLIEKCYEMGVDDYRLLLNRFENGCYSKSSDEVMEIIKKAVNIPGLSKGFSMECERELIDYYYNNLEGELMESHLLQLDLSYMSAKDRVRIIEYMILRELYNLALQKMEIYGCEGVDVKKLLKLCTKLIPNRKSKDCSLFFLKLCFHVFSKRKYNESLLSFLNVNYNGRTEDMYEIWEAAMGFNLDITELEERILAQLLFAENDMCFAREVFRHYYGHYFNRKLVRAFLSYYSYGYLLGDRLLDSELINIIRRELNYDENDVCMLALMKNYSEQEELTENEKLFIEKQLLRLEQKGLTLPFFKDYKGRVNIPDAMHDKYYVEYHTNPKKRVRIHYCIEGNSSTESYIVENMNDICYGIFVREFILFYGESLQYYITEEGDGGEVVTESREIRPEPELIGSEDTKYHQLNLIITAKEMNDDKTVIKLLESYISNDYMSTHLFRPI